MPRSAEKQTRETEQIEGLLREHFPGFPPAYPPRAYRYNSASIRIRLVHPMFQGMNRIEREEKVVPILRNNLDERTWWDVTFLILLTPDELSGSLANLEFEHPRPSRF